MTRGKKKPWGYILIFLLVVALDQVTKFWARTHLAFQPIVVIPDFFSLSYVSNRGAAFGILQKQTLLFICLTVAIIYLVYRNYHEIPKERGILFGLYLALGGAVGNLIDRIIFGAVTDFIAFRFWYVFNVADSAIFIGLLLFGWNYVAYERKNKERAIRENEGGVM